MRIQRTGGYFGMVMVMLLSLWAGGCVRTTQPILRDDQEVPEDALLGKWVSTNGTVSAELTSGDNGRYKLVYTNEQKKTGHFLVRFGKIGEVLVAEISADVPYADSEEFKSLLMPLYSMMVIEKTQPQLVLTSPAVDWFKTYITAHPNELDVNNTDDMVVQSSTEDFQTFFTKHYKEAGMLGNPGAFVRPGDPSTQPAVGK